MDFAVIRELQVQNRWDDAAELLLAQAQALEAVGAELVVLGTNYMHKIAPSPPTAWTSSSPAPRQSSSAAPSWSFSAPPRTAPRRCCPPPGLHIHAAIDAALARVGRAARSARAPVVTVGFLAARWGPPSIWPRRIHARAASGNGPAGAGATGQGGVVPDLGVLHRQKGIHLRSASK
jgi:hypothetical protein